MAIEQTLWVEKYRPTKIEDCVLPPKMKRIIRGFIRKNEIPHMMLTGSPGTGKTTCAKALANQLGSEYIFIDCSTENGKADVVNNIVPFASTVSIVDSDKPKFIICDECLEENETVRVGTIDNYKDVPLKELERNKMYPVVSMNMETKELENDTAYLCTDKADDLFEVTLSNGKTIICNKNHPFVIENEDGTTTKIRVKDGIEGRVCFEFKFIMERVTVVSVKPLNRKGRVMDIHVTKNHTFITSGGLVTSNCDFLTKSSQSSLRPIIEQYSKTTRFIFTGNYAERLIPALKSRCAQFDMTVTKEDKPQMLTDFYKRCEKILKENNVEYDAKSLALFINKLFPDFRKIINELQSYSSSEGKIDEGILTISSDEIAANIYPLLIEKDYKKCRKWLSETLSSPDDIFSSLYNAMKDYIKPEQQPELIIILAQYQYYSSRVANQNINLMACFLEMMSNINGSVVPEK